MHEFKKSALRVNNTVGNKFNVKVGVHQGSVLSPFPTGIHLLKVENRNTRTRCEIYSQLTMKTPERR